jgi:hypothetical protein
LLKVALNTINQINSSNNDWNVHVISRVWVLNLCLNYRFVQQLTRSRTVYCKTRCEKIIEHR